MCLFLLLQSRNDTLYLVCRCTQAVQTLQGLTLHSCWQVSALTPAIIIPNT